MCAYICQLPPSNLDMYHIYSKHKVKFVTGAFIPRVMGVEQITRKSLNGAATQVTPWK